MGIKKVSGIALLGLLKSYIGCIGVEPKNSVYEYLPETESNDIPRPIDDYVETGIVIGDDETADVLRDVNAFNYKSLLKTDLDIELKLYDLNDVEPEALARRAVNFAAITADDFAQATIRLENLATGRIIYSGKTKTSGRLQAELILPAHTGDCRLTIHQAGYHDRSIIIEAIARFAKIGRKMALAADAASAENVLADSDGDLIPNIYDAFPNDPERAFKNTIPADESLTITFEDNFPRLGDGDYNDFIARYTVHEVLDADNKLIELNGNAYAIARVAGYDHRFGMVINFTGGAELTVNNLDYAGNLTATTVSDVTESANIVFFERTKRAFTRLNGGRGVDNGYADRPRSEGHTTGFTLVFDEPLDRSEADLAPFDPYLYIHNTGYDVHLIGKPALPGSNNPPSGDVSFRDGNGYPRALLVPIDFAYPKESISIELAYDRFDDWRLSLGQTNSDWYLFPNPDYVLEQPNDFPAVTITADDGSWVFEAPEGAIGANVNVEIISPAVFDVPLGYKIIGDASFEFRPEGLVLNEPATLTIYYDETTNSLDERLMAFYYAVAGEAEVVPTVKDYDDHSAVVTIDVFQKYGGLMAYSVDSAIAGELDDNPEIIADMADTIRTMMLGDFPITQQRYLFYIENKTRLDAFSAKLAEFYPSHPLIFLLRFATG